MRLLLYHFITLLALKLFCGNEECANDNIQVFNGIVNVTGQTYIAGGLQVCVNNSWATVCHIGWNEPDGIVACRQLGLSYIRTCNESCFGNKLVDPSFYNFQCRGNEPKLVYCKHTVIDKCYRAAGVYCGFTRCENGSIRITNGTASETNKTYYIAGGLQVCVNNRWFTISQCDWDEPDAIVACRQLGLSYFRHYGESCFGNTNTALHIFGFSCTGNESQLAQCSFEITDSIVQLESAGVYPIAHLEPARVYCAIAGRGEVTDTDVPTVTEKTAATEQQSFNMTVMTALVAVTASLGIALICVIICLILTCFKLYNLSSSKRNQNWSMDNNVYGLKDLSSSEQPIPQDSEYDLPHSNANQLPQQQIIQNTDNEYQQVNSDRIEDDQEYSTLHHENTTKKVNVHATTEGDQVYSVPHDENISNKANVHAKPDGDQDYSVLHDNSIIEEDHACDEVTDSRVYSVLHDENITKKENVHAKPDNDPDYSYSVLQVEGDHGQGKVTDGQVCSVTFDEKSGTSKNIQNQEARAVSGVA